MAGRAPASKGLGRLGPYDSFMVRPSLYFSALYSLISILSMGNTPTSPLISNVMIVSLPPLTVDLY